MLLVAPARNLLNITMWNIMVIHCLEETLLSSFFRTILTVSCQVKQYPLQSIINSYGYKVKDRWSNSKCFSNTKAPGQDNQKEQKPKQDV